MAHERFIEDVWPTHLVNPEILFTDDGMAQAERLSAGPRPPKHEVRKGLFIFVMCDMRRHRECESENPINICTCDCHKSKGGTK